VAVRVEGLIAERFELEAPAGSGGMGVVYRARDRSTGERVALKLLLARASRIDDAALRQSFLDCVPENARTLELAALADAMTQAAGA